MAETNYLKLKKPAYGEPADIEVINANMDAIDAGLVDAFGSAFVVCAATYDAAAKRHTLTPVQVGIVLPEVFTAKFLATASFKAGDKVYLNGVEYTPAYNDSDDPVEAGVWMLGAVVDLPCSTLDKKAFVGMGHRSALSKKANKDWVQTELDARMHFLGQIEDRNLLEWLNTQPSGWFVVAGTNTGIPIETYYYGKWFRASNILGDGTCELTAIVYNWKYTINKINGVWETKWREDPTMEGGTWVPEVIGVTTGRAVLDPTSNGRWYKVGNLMHIKAIIKFVSKGTITGTDGFKILGLPVAANPGYQSGNVGYWAGAVSTMTHPLQIQVDPEAINIFRSGGPGVVSRLGIHEITDNFLIQDLTATYTI